MDREANGGFLRGTGKLQLPSLQWRRCGPSGFPLTGGPWTNRPNTNDLWSTPTRVRTPGPSLRGRGGGDTYPCPSPWPFPPAQGRRGHLPVSEPPALLSEAGMEGTPTRVQAPGPSLRGRGGGDTYPCLRQRGHLPVSKPPALPSRAGAEGTPYLPVLCPMSSADCLTQSWALSM